ncbi:rCG59357 [Rattus norvegicus]|uniref:RCG59357 n=1 Tax=Rattus norvegicus TaxID=10116 RepID=A6KSZ4_RAT|nr:rCG59357 [Rattus norvegicus]
MTATHQPGTELPPWATLPRPPLISSPRPIAMGFPTSRKRLCSQSLHIGSLFRGTSYG